MSKYDNSPTKIYPDLNLSTPSKPKTRRLKRIAEIERYIFDEIEVCERLRKKVKQFNIIDKDHR